MTDMWKHDQQLLAITAATVADRERLAALTCTEHATDAEDLLELLGMLGLDSAA